MGSSRKSKREQAKDALPEDADERWDIVTATVFQTIREAMEELGYSPKIVLMLEDGERQGILASGFSDPGEGFAFVMDMATAYAETVGIRMIATRATGPISEGQG